MSFLYMVIIGWPIRGGARRIWGGESLEEEKEELWERGEVWVEVWCGVSKCEYWDDT